MSEKGCTTCRHLDKDSSEEPCVSRITYDCAGWEPLQTLTKEVKQVEKHACIRHLDCSSDLTRDVVDDSRMLESYLGTCEICKKTYFVETYVRIVKVEDTY